ncbi:MAG: hypothetical protein ACE5HD_05540 [Acidobacteriota bacterium]
MQRSVALAASFAALGLLTPAIAQVDSPTIAREYSLEAKPGQTEQFEAALKKQMEWYQENGEGWRWQTWQWDTGEKLGQYVIRSPGHRWEDLDQRRGQKVRASAHFREVVRPYVESMTSSIGTVLAGASHWPADLGQVPMVSVYTFQLNYGMDEAFNHQLARIRKAVEASDWPVHYLWGTTVSGGEAGTYWLVIPHRTWADLRGPEKEFWTMMEETIGRQEADAMRGTFRKCVREQHTALARFRPELSYAPSDE